MEHLETLLSSSEGQAKYIAWMKGEVTQIMMRELRELSRPRTTTADHTGQSAAAELGRLRGVQEIVDVLSRYSSAPQPGRAGLPQADYGTARVADEEK